MREILRNSQRIFILLFFVIMMCSCFMVAAKSGSNNEQRLTATPRPTSTHAPTPTSAVPPQGVEIDVSYERDFNGSDFLLRSITLPQAWQSPAEAPPLYRVQILVENREILDCNLRSTNTLLSRMRVDVRVSVINMVSGATLGEEVVAGNSATCPQFPVGTSNRPLVGAIQSLNELEIWLFELLNQQSELETLDIATLPREGLVISTSGTDAVSHYRSVVTDEQRTPVGVLPHYELVLYLWKENVEDCLYYSRVTDTEPSIVMVRNRYFLDARIIDIVSGEDIANREFEGTMPRECPFTLDSSSRSTGQLDIRLQDGNRPTAATVAEWVSLQMAQLQSSFDSEIVPAGIAIAPTDDPQANRYIDRVPERWFAPDGGVPRYQVTIQYTTIEEQCTYRLYNVRVVRQRFVVEAIIVDFATDEVAAEISVSGSEPAECPETFTIEELLNPIIEIKGTSPSVRQFVNELNTTLEELPDVEPNVTE